MTIEEARIRNWQKSRLTGFCLNVQGLTPEEVDLYQEMVRLKNKLLNNWDAQTNTISVTPVKKYRCWCGKRTNVEYTDPKVSLYAVPYLCKKHFKEAKEVLNGSIRTKT